MRLKDLGTLQIALGISIAVHAALLLVRFAAPEQFNRVFRGTPLEVVLVNARGNERPDRAQVLAQANLAGGGDLDQGRATSPLPPSAFTVVGDADEQAERRIDAMQERQNLVLAQLKQQLAAMPPPDPRTDGQPADAMAQEEKRRQLLEQVAEIERRINTQNARPRKRVVEPNARESVYALYMDSMRRRIEARGTRNFPEVDGHKLYGSVGIVISVNFDGRLLRVDVVQGSGLPALDRRAVAIVDSLGNFGPFTPAMRRQSEQIEIPWRFSFTRDETLQTQASAPAE